MTIHLNRRTLLAGAAASAFLFATQSALAETYPTRQVRIITPNPGKLNFGTSGIGTTVDLAGRALQQIGDIDAVNIAYRGVSGLVPDLMSGQIDVAMFGVTAIASQIKSGAVRGLGVTTQKRIAALPDLPPVSDSVKGFDFPAWYALLGPAGMQQAVTNQLANAIAKLQADPDFIEKVGEEGDSPKVMGPAALTRFMASESARFGKLVKDANIVVK